LHITQGRSDLYVGNIIVI